MDPDLGDQKRPDTMDTDPDLQHCYRLYATPKEIH